MKQRILCCCEAGLVRSTALKDAVYWNWNARDVLNCGLNGNQPETIRMLCDWADAILVVTPELAKHIDETNRSKVIVVDIGEDIYGSSTHSGLRSRINAALERVTL